MEEYSQAVAELLALGHELHNLPSAKFELWQMRKLCAALGSPQKNFPCVLIAGTNGKGSTSAMLASMLQAAGYKVGLYTSPHLVRINERIRLNGEPIADADFAAAHRRVASAARMLAGNASLPHLPSFFEMLTAMAFVHFAAVQVDIAILEVGMGGRLDATNIVEPRLCIVTDIALDHQKYLGSTLGAIAGEKACILRANTPAVTLRQGAEIDAVLDAAIEETGAEPLPADPLLRQLEILRMRVETGSESILLEPRLAGRHQTRNLALAVTAALRLRTLGFAMNPQHLAQGVKNTSWPARMQYLPATAERPALLLDVAHNPAGARVLHQALHEIYGSRAQVFVFGALRDKAIAEMVQILFSRGSQVIATAAANPRSATAAEVCQMIGAAGGMSLACEPVAAALRVAFDAARRLEQAGEPEPLVVVCGSIYVVGAAMQELGLQA
jgi:dihydrofolate synthase/folylpolyglutamate synthase